MVVSSEHRSGLLEVLEKLLEIPTADLEVAMSTAADLIAKALRADKVDAFLYDAARDSLVALGVSHQPLSALQKRHGLDVLPLANCGRTAHVFLNGETYLSGNVDEDDLELRGIRDALGVRSAIGVPLDVGGVRRGMIMVASQQPNFFTPEDARFLESIARWVGTVAHRTELVAGFARHGVEQGRRAVAEELITVLAHDLRNYLTPVDLRLTLLHRRAEAEKRERDLRDIVVAERNMARTHGLIDEILDVARIDGGIMFIDPQPTDMVALMREAAAALATPDHPIDVKASLAVVALADPSRVRQCIDNLLSNAVRYSPRGAGVSVEVATTVASGREAARVEIIDQGPGVEPELLPHVFERFSTGARRTGGLGLGLYLAKRIAVLHGGDLTVVSPPGSGARFVLVLPLATGEP